MEMVTVDTNATLFCRSIIALSLLVAALTKSSVLLLIVIILMLLSGLLGISKAPLILLYKYTLGKLIKNKNEVECVDSVRFSHFVGSIMGIVGYLLIFLNFALVGWIIVWILTAMQIIAVFGFCSAKKLYECVVLGRNCCNLGKKIRGGKCNV